jgi:hypothetical protein
MHGSMMTGTVGTPRWEVGGADRACLDRLVLLVLRRTGRDKR